MGVKASKDSVLVEEYRKRQAEANYDDLCNILYTSGTTGQSKGVMLTYGQYREGLRVNDAVLPLSEDDVFSTFFPILTSLNELGVISDFLRAHFNA